MSTTELKAYDIFKNKLGEQEAAAVMEYFDEKTAKTFQEKKTDLTTKEDLANVRIEIREVKADLIKWMFIFWIGQLAAIIAIVKLFL